MLSTTVLLWHPLCIFYCLPMATTWVPYGSSYEFTMFSYGFHVAPLQFSYSSAMDSLLSSYGIAIVYLWGSYRFPIFPPMGFLWSPLWIAYRSLWLTLCFLWVSYGSPTVFIPPSFFANFWGPQLGSGRLGGFWFPGGVVSEFKSPPPRRSSQPMTPSLPAPRYCPNRIFLRAGLLQSPIAFAAFDPKYPKNPRRASRAGLLHFAMAFARRIAPFRYGLAAFEHKYPKFPRRASRAGLLKPPYVSCSL